MDRRVRPFSHRGDLALVNLVLAASMLLLSKERRGDIVLLDEARLVVEVLLGLVLGVCGLVWSRC